MNHNPPSILLTEPDKNPIDVVRQLQPDMTHDGSEVISILPEGTTITIGQIRKLRQELQFTGARGQIIIFHTFEKATIEAQNALLKILEDLAEIHSFYLFTNRVDALLPTIRSRCVISTKHTISCIDADPEMIEILAKLKRGNCATVLAHPLLQPSSLDDARDTLENIISTLRSDVLTGDTWAVGATKYACEILSLSRSNNLNAQLSIDAWVIRVSTNS